MNSGFISQVRRATAIIAANTIGKASRFLGRGAGTSLPGIVAERIDPGILSDLGGQLAHGSILVTGTNGKTTTARMIADILSAHGYEVVRNRAGANMLRGLVTSLVETARPDGHVPNGERAIGVFEVDEAFLPAAISELRPKRVVLLNVFRDQLDRYGEVANVPAIWREPLGSLPEDSVIVANADDPLVAEVASQLPKTYWYGLEVTGAETVEHGGDVKMCPRCGGIILYSVRYYGHLGKYASPCGFARPAPDVVARDVQPRGLEGSIAHLVQDGQKRTVNLPLSGLYNVTNATAAAATVVSLGVPLQIAVTALEQLTSAFGRMESFSTEGKVIYLLLGKNPTGYNQVVRTVFDEATAEPRTVLFMLNDNAADGRDVSWIWDVDFERIRGRTGYVACAGTRAADMSLRLKYAGVDADKKLFRNTFSSTAEALDRCIAATLPGSELYIFATYTAMLDVRKLLTKRKIATPYWER